MVAVNLVRADGTLVGLVGQQRVDLLLDVPRSSAGLRGECLGAAVGGYWRIESNFQNLHPVGIFLGEYAGTPVHLRSEVHLTPYYTVRHADISGTIGDLELRARAAPVEAPADGPLVIGIDGQFDGDTITLFATIVTDLSGGQLNGIIGAHPLHIDVTGASVSGNYDGPPALFLLLVGSLLYFV